MAKLSFPSLEELYVQEDMRKQARRGLLNAAVQQTQAAPQMPVNTPQANVVGSQPVVSEYQAPSATAQTTAADDLSPLFANLPSRADSYTSAQANQVADAINAGTINVDQAGKFYGMDPKLVQANLDSINAARAAADQPDLSSNESTTTALDDSPAGTGLISNVAAGSADLTASNAAQFPPLNKGTQSFFDAIKASQAANNACLLYTSPSPRDRTRSRMPSSA